MIRIKVLAKLPVSAAHFGAMAKIPKDATFILDPSAREYDWLLVYDDLPPRNGERFSMSDEVLACPPENTILLTYEPSSIKVYGHDYASQFGMVMTSHEPNRLPHPLRRDVPPVSAWYYGDEMDLLPEPPLKTETLSFFASGKSEGHTMHRLRYEFSERVHAHFRDRSQLFGRPHRFIEKKSEALDSFRYTLALENHLSPHHWTEKLSDAFLGYCLPFYAGCPNASDYFPTDSYVPIDMRDAQSAIETIEASIDRDIYARRLPAIIEARRRVIEEYGIAQFALAAIHAAETGRYVPRNGGRILSRRRMRLRTPLAFLRYAYEKAENRRYFNGQMAAYRARIKD